MSCGLFVLIGCERGSLTVLSSRQDALWQQPCFSPQAPQWLHLSHHAIIQPTQSSNELVTHVHKTSGGSRAFFPGPKFTGHKDVRAVAVAKARVSTLRFFVDDLPSFANVVKALWQTKFETSGIEPTSSYVPDDDEDKLTERVRGHVLGNITSFSTSTIDGTPNVQPAVNGGGFNDDAIMKLGLADHLYDANLVLHTKIMQNLRNSNKQHQKPIAAQVLSQSNRAPNS